MTPVVIAHMEFRSLADGEAFPPIEMVRVLIHSDAPRTDGWAAAA